MVYGCETSGELIRFIRLRACMTQQELADYLHIQQNSVCCYETNRRFPLPCIMRHIVELANANDMNIYASDFKRKLKNEIT